MKNLVFQRGKIFQIIFILICDLRKFGSMHTELSYRIKHVCAELIQRNSWKENGRAIKIYKILWIHMYLDFMDNWMTGALSHMYGITQWVMFNQDAP